MQQHPLIETRPSLSALQEDLPQSPGAVFVGLGVASGTKVGRALPLDVVGLLLGAEAVRRTLGAKHLCVLIADAHAMAHGAPEMDVAMRARATERTLQGIAAACKLEALTVVRGTRLHDRPDYRQLLQQVYERAPADTEAYVAREIADIGYFHHHFGGIVKVGWALQGSLHSVERDERLFDVRHRQWLGPGPGFIYGKVGRALDDRYPRMPPYLEWVPERRICLAHDEDVEGKLARAAQRLSPCNLRGVRNHLKAITRTYSQMVQPLHGTLEGRTQALVDAVFAARPAATGTDRPMRAV